MSKSDDDIILNVAVLSRTSHRRGLWGALFGAAAVPVTKDMPDITELPMDGGTRLCYFVDFDAVGDVGRMLLHAANEREPGHKAYEAVKRMLDEDIYPLVCMDDITVVRSRFGLWKR